MLTDILAIVCGGVVGFSLALTGGGGSILAIPLLLYVVGLRDIHLAIGTSALAVSLNSYINLIPHARAGHVRWYAGIVFSITGVIGAFIGAALGKRVGGNHLTVLFALLVIVVAVLMLRGRKAKASADDGTGGRHTGSLAGIGLGTGGVAGFFGVGGGFLCVPGLILATRMSMVDAIGTSLVGVGSFGLATAISYAWSGLIDWPLAGEFILGGVAGGWIGAIVAHRLATKRGVLNIIFSVMLIVIAVYMLIKTVHL